MAKTLTDAATWAAVQTPEPGDDVTADLGNAGDVQEAFQKLMNRDRYLLARLSPWTVPASISCGDAAQVTVEGAASLDTNDAIASANITPNALGNNTWYYLYAASGPTLQVSTTAPDAAAVASSADATLRYLGSFRTNGSGAILSFGAQRGRHTYDSEIRVLLNGTADAWTTINIDAQAPPTARAVRLRVFASSARTNSNVDSFQVKSSEAAAGETGTEFNCPNSVNGSGVNGTVTGFVTLRLGTTRAFQYRRVGSPAGLNVSVYVLGYDE